ncbi:MAG: FAD-dependent thymidylate synthase [candidate division WOR-3 bacterium]
MKVSLIDSDPIEKCIIAARTSHGSTSDNMGPKDKNLIKNLIKWGHTSIFEHCNYTFKIEGVSRALLQELVRHRMASYTVRSTRYTLKDLIKDEEIGKAKSFNDYKKIVERYCVVPELPEKILKSFYKTTAQNLKSIFLFLNKYKIPNDIAKYLLPESFKTELVMSINVRSFRNFLQLRTSKNALWEIRKLAFLMYESIPLNHRILYEDLGL